MIIGVREKWCYMVESWDGWLEQIYLKVGPSLQVARKGGPKDLYSPSLARGLGYLDWMNCSFHQIIWLMDLLSSRLSGLSVVDVHVESTPSNAHGRKTGSQIKVLGDGGWCRGYFDSVRLTCRAINTFSNSASPGLCFLVAKNNHKN